MGAAARIRPERPGDAGPVRALLRRAFGVEKVVTLVDLIRASPGFIPALSLVAEVDGDVVGHVLLSRVVVRTADGAADIVCLSPLAVDSAHQRLGVGGALLRHGVDAARTRGEVLVVLEGDPRYYRRHGFRPAGERGILRPSPRIPEEAFMVMTLTPTGEALRGSVEYSSPFWRADCVGP